jgi:hypothetical protein
VFEVSLEKLFKLHLPSIRSKGVNPKKAFLGVHIGVHDSAKMDEIGQDWGKQEVS